MTVARSDALAAAARSVMTSSPTSAPAARSESRPGSIRHTCDSSGTRSRKPPMMSSKPAVSAKQARAPESERIHSACSAEEVS